jgi:hypothetical protein
MGNIDVVAHLGQRALHDTGDANVVFDKQNMHG